MAFVSLRIYILRCMILCLMKRRIFVSTLATKKNLYLSLLPLVFFEKSGGDKISIPSITLWTLISVRMKRMSRNSASVKSQLGTTSVVPLRRKKKPPSIPLSSKSQSRRAIEGGIDVTPKPLTYHQLFGSVDKDQRFLDFELVQRPSETSDSHRSIVSSFTSFSGIFCSSCISHASSESISSLRHDAHHAHLSKTSGGTASIIEELPLESIFTTETGNELFQTEKDSLSKDGHVDLALSPFHLSSHGDLTFSVPPEIIKFSLKETETYFMLELPQLLEDIPTPDEEEVQEDNVSYVDSLTSHKSMTKQMDAMTQTIHVLTKTRGTYLDRGERFNRGTYVTNWLMYDNYKTFEPSAREVDVESRIAPLEERFRAVSVLVERLIANNLYAEAQKRYNGLVNIDYYSPELKFIYGLRLLWEHKCPSSRGRAVSSLRWNYATSTILAVAYGSARNSPTTDGLVAIWCMKNPSRPGRTYSFNSPVADIDWSRVRPNWLAVSLYDGTIRVLDVSRDSTLTATKSIRQSIGITRSPKWQVQWWPGDEQLVHQEQIYTCDQDGRVFCYSPADSNFTFTEIAKVSRIDGRLNGVQRTFQSRFISSRVPISRNAGALILRRHPSQNTIYFVGTDEGGIYRCSTNYLHQHIDSFLAHDGPIYSLEFSPFCPKIFLTSGADWCIRVWHEGLEQPLLTLRTTIACVRCATWSPTNSTVIASIVNNQICIWDVKRKIHSPMSIIVSREMDSFVKIGFTLNGNQLVAADLAGTVRVYDLEGMPFPPYDQQKVLVEAIERLLIVKPSLLKKLKALGPPF